MREHILHSYELLNSRDRDGFSALVRQVFAPDVEVVEPGGTSDLETALAGWVALLDAFEDLHFTTLTVTETSGRLVVEHLVRGTHTGTLRTVAGDVPASGRPVQVPLITVVEHEDDQVRRWR
jgi:hypothetical protein